MHTLITHKQHAQIMVLLQWEISLTLHYNSQLALGCMCMDAHLYLHV